VSTKKIEPVRYADVPDALGFWMDLTAGKVEHVLDLQEGAKYCAAPGRYFGPVVLPERQTDIVIEAGDATHVPDCYGLGRTVIIAHGCNAQGKWGAGFSGVLSKAYPLAEARYRDWAAGRIMGAPPLELGRVQLVPTVGKAACGVFVANMITQERVREHPGERVFSAEAFLVCVDRVSEMAREVKADAIIMPAIGTGLGGASWDTDVKPVALRLCARGLRVRVFSPNR
jgi:O-acetyl-ADP-ribose deacetylase (regulator of RNase III)